MAATESLTIARGIDDKVKVVDQRLESVDDGMKVVDHKVGLIIDGELYRIRPIRICSQPLPGRCKRNWSSGSTSGHSVHRFAEFVIV